jgi:hypothetical protein
MSKEKSKAINEQIETQSVVERISTVCCGNCGGDVDLGGQPIPTQFLNGIEVKSRVYCDMCKQVGAIKEGWMPQPSGRISKMFVVK